MNGNNGEPLDREALQRERMRLQFVIDGAGLGIWEWNMQTNQTVFNEAWARMLGYSLEELTPYSYETWVSLTHPDDLQRAEKQLRLCAEGKIPNYDVEIRMRHKDGHWVWILDRSRIMTHDAAGKPLLMFGTHTDITERKRIEEALRESRERLDLAMDVANDGVWDWDVVNNETYFDARYYTMAGYAAHEFPGTFAEWAHRVHPDDLKAAQAALEDHFKNGTPGFDIEFRWRRKDGTYMWIRGRGKTVARQPDGSPRRIIGTHTDVTQRREAEEALRRSEGRFQNMLGLVPDMISIQDPDMNILYCNWQGFAAVAQEKRRCNTKCHIALRDLPSPCPDCLAKTVIASGRTVQKEVALPDGRWLDVRIIPLLDAHGRVELFMEWVRDITEQKKNADDRDRLQTQLAQAQKMESIGRLAGGVAHDFNNMLGVILGYSEMTLADLEPTHPHYADLVEIRNAAERSAGFTRQLLAFARKQTVAPKVLDLNETINGMLAMMRRLIGEDIDLCWRPGERLGTVKIDPTQIDQILANLCVNARDAIENTGRVIIETANTMFDAAYTATHPDALPGHYVMLAVSDSGSGIEPEVLAHLFEPFFTTKDVGKGTGLGLATVYGIVKQNRGFIIVYSERGQGTTFKIFLPRHDGPVTNPTPSLAPAQPTTGREVILLVEDEPSILQMTSVLLTTRGYTVLPASTPRAALRLAKENKGAIDLLITDVVMPGMNGRELAQQLQTAFPALRCLFMSGYTADVIADRGVLEDGVAFIQKPFTTNELFAKVRSTLDRVPNG